MAEKKQRYLTPDGFAKYARLNKPQPPFGGDPNKGAKYKIDVCFDPKDPKWAAWGSELRAIAKSLGTDKIPIKKEVDESDQPTGRLYVRFQTGEQYKPGVFDKYGQPLPEGILVGNDSKVKVAYTVNHYDGFGGGVNLYLSAVQVLDLIEYKGRSAEGYGFTVESAPAGAKPPAAQQEDDLPF